MRPTAVRPIGTTMIRRAGVAITDSVWSAAHSPVLPFSGDPEECEAQ